MRQWFEIKNKADRAEIWIYEQIGEDFWTGEGITAKSFQKELATIKAAQIDLHINSPGGEVFDGITIYNLLKQHPANITTYIDGLAASTASVIALAGDKVVMAGNALYMVHNPWGMAMGSADDMRDMAERLDKVGGSLALAYIEKTGKKDAEIREMMTAETWMSAEEAKEAGFVDEITEEMDMAACAKFVPAMAKAKFKHVPEAIAGKARLTARDLEDALRDKGCTEAMAKSILANGFRDEQREVAPRAVEQREVAAPAPKEERIADPVNDLFIRAARLLSSHQGDAATS